VYQRSANWCTPLNNRPITPEEQAQLRAGLRAMCETLNTSPSGFLHPATIAPTFDDSEEERTGLLREDVESPGFSKLTSNYSDLTVDHAANAAVVRVHRRQRSGASSRTRDGRAADPQGPPVYAEKRPPFVTGYYEAYNKPNVELVDLKQTPMVRVTETGSRRPTAAGVRHHRVGHRLRLRHRRAGAPGHPGPGRSALEDHWADGPKTFLGIQTAGFPNFFFPGGPHAAAGNNPRYNGDQVDFITETLVYLRDHGYDVIEVEPEAEEKWTAMVDRRATKASRLRGEQLLLRDEHPRKAPQVPAELRRPAEALQGDRQGQGDRLRGLHPLAVVRSGRSHRLRATADFPGRLPVRPWPPASTASPRCRAAAAGAR
jgi:cation diffusion facilitator CzcD-associated flavoprotein CzcO